MFGSVILSTIIVCAERDGVVTSTQRAYIEKIAHALGLDKEPLPEITGLAENNELAEGMYTCFSGAAFIDRSTNSRSELEFTATVAPMVQVTSGTRRNYDILVAADPASRSGKARKTHQFNIPLMDVETFLSKVIT